MMMRILTTTLCLLFTATAISTVELTPGEFNFLDTRIRPELIRECYSCHSNQTAATLAIYGVDKEETASFGRQCLLARRMAEFGVRFVEVTQGPWDQHTNLKSDHKARAAACDRPIAGLLQDLKQRDMLKDTLVIWGGEFGRSPEAQGADGDGRNHNNKGYTARMAGGGVKGGFSYGAIDELGYETVENKCHIHDWHATILHLLSLDHQRRTYRYAGRDFRLTDVHGNVAHDIIA